MLRETIQHPPKTCAALALYVAAKVSKLVFIGPNSPSGSAAVRLAKRFCSAVLRLKSVATLTRDSKSMLSAVLAETLRAWMEDWIARYQRCKVVKNTRKVSGSFGGSDAGDALEHIRWLQEIVRIAQVGDPRLDTPDLELEGNTKTDYTASYRCFTNFLP